MSEQSSIFKFLNARQTDVNKCTHAKHMCKVESSIYSAVINLKAWIQISMKAHWTFQAVLFRATEKIQAATIFYILFGTLFFYLYFFLLVLFEHLPNSTHFKKCVKENIKSKQQSDLFMAICRSINRARLLERKGLFVVTQKKA